MGLLFHLHFHSFHYFFHLLLSYQTQEKSFLFLFAIIAGSDAREDGPRYLGVIWSFDVIDREFRGEPELKFPYVQAEALEGRDYEHAFYFYVDFVNEFFIVASGLHDLIVEHRQLRCRIHAVEAIVGRSSLAFRHRICELITSCVLMVLRPLIRWIMAVVPI